MLPRPAAAYYKGNPNQLEFRDPVQGNLPNYVKAALEEAYAELGITLNYLPMPRQRSLVEANKGNIAGELARIPEINDDYPNLRRVDFPLYAFNVVLVADRRRCGICAFEQIENVAHVNGVQIIEDFLIRQPRQRPVATMESIKQLTSLLENNRVEAILMTDFEFQQTDLAKQRHYIRVPLERALAYHYVNKKHANLIPRLERKLLSMHDSGRIEQLLEQHNVSLPNGTPPLQQQPLLRLIADNWDSLTNSDGSGMYWQLMRRIFSPVAEELELNASSFRRANLSLAERRYDVMLAAYDQLQPEGTIISETHFDYDQPVYVIANSKDTIKDIQAGELKLPVCHTQGYSYEEFLPKGMLYYAASGSLDCFALLDLGRVAAVIDYRRNIPEWLESSHAEMRLHDGLPLQLVFQNTPLGRQLRSHYEKTMRELVQSGEITDIYDAEQLRKANLIPKL
ncbi:MAG: hypothetical protein WEA82_06540 [Idiomarina sp.]